jgi:predicted transcriptional regulator
VDKETIAKDLVAAYVAQHDIPEKNEMQEIAEQLVQFYKLTKAQLDKTSPNAAQQPMGFGKRAVQPNKSFEDQESSSKPWDK